MSERGGRPIPPTEFYTVTDVAGHTPVVLDDFVGATTVVVKADDQEFRLRGVGARQGPAVQFHEKEPASATDDTPVWEISQQGDGHMIAEPPPT